MEPEIIEILKRIEARLGGLEDRLERTEGKVDKNTILLEDLTKKVQIVAEVQTSHKEQNERQSGKVIDTLIEKSDIVETALTNVSKDTKEIKDSIEVLKEMTGKHEVDINILKRRPV